MGLDEIKYPANVVEFRIYHDDAEDFNMETPCSCCCSLKVAAFVIRQVSSSKLKEWEQMYPSWMVLTCLWRLLECLASQMELFRCVAIDNQGNIIHGFAMKIHPCSVVEVELWALFHGVSMAMEKQFVKVVMESDSQRTIDFLVGGSIAVNSLCSIIDSTLKAVKSTCEVSWSKIPRESKKVADCLAKFSLISNCNFVHYDSTPHLISSLLSEDKMRMASL